MYAYIKGTLAYTGSDYAVLDVGGIGYKIMTPARMLANLEKGKENTLYTYLVVREDELSLYGFLSEQEKNMFERLISVSGIGPKVGMAILSGLTLSEIAGAIIAGDEKAFSAVPGIGKKTAQRLLLELRDKIDTREILPRGMEATLPSGDTPANEAVLALMSLGYAKAEAAAAVGAVTGLADTVEDLTLLALKRLSR